jgi:hypothetical protein
MNFLNIFSINNFFFFLILIIIFILSFKYGKKLSVNLILATYPTILIFKSIDLIKIENNIVAVITILIIYLFCFWVLGSIIHTQNPYKKINGFFEYLILAIAFMILFSAVSTISIPIIDKFIDLGSISLFINKYISYNMALIIPIVAILLTNRKRL